MKGSEKDKDVCAGFNCDKGFIRGAMGGTMCLNGAWCLKGRCTPDSRAPRVPGRWQWDFLLIKRVLKATYSN